MRVLDLSKQSDRNIYALSDAEKIKIKDFNVQTEGYYSRSGEPKKLHDKIYIWINGETVWENIQNRRVRPYVTYKNEVIPMVMEKLKNEYPKVYERLKDVKWGWNQNCGCSMCPCSPGFVGDVRREYTDELYCIHVGI